MSVTGGSDGGEKSAGSDIDSPWGGDIRIDEQDGKGDKPAAPGESDGARNPWAAPSEDTQARRSASLEDIFRQRRGGGSGGLPSMPRPAWLPWVLAGSLTAWLVSTSLHMLSPGEQGLVTTLGRHTRTVGPGLSFSLPWPFERVLVRNTAKVEQTLLPEKENAGLMLTRDGQLIDIGFQLRWKVRDLKQFSYAAPDSEAAIRALAMSEMRAGIAETRFDTIWGEGESKRQLQSRIATRTQAVLDVWRLGVRIEGVEIVKANPPAQLSEAFQKAASARDRAQKAKDEAQKWAQGALGSAHSEAAAFNQIYAQYRLAPEVTRRRLYYETMERVLSSNDKLVVGTGAGVQVTLPENKATPKPQSAGGQ